MSRTTKACTCVLAVALWVVGIILILSYAIFPSVISSYIDRELVKKVVWTSDSEEDVEARFNGTDSESGKFYASFYFWNITNVEDV